MRLPLTKHLLTGAAFVALMLVSAPATPVSTSRGTASALPSATATMDLDAGAKAVEGRQYDVAVQRLTRAIDSRTLEGEALALAYHHRGIARQKLGFDGMAVLDYTLAIEQNALPKDVLARAYYNRGLAISEGGDRISAERDYSRAIELVPSYAAAYHNRANLERARADYPTAIRDYTVAISHLNESDRKLPLMGRALAQEKSGNVVAAMADIDRVLALDSNYAPAVAKRSELASLANNLSTGSIASEPMREPALQPGNGRVVNRSSQGGWKTTAVRYDTEDVSASDGEDIETASLRDIDMVPAPTTRQTAIAIALPQATAPVSQAMPQTLAGGYRLQLGAFRARGQAESAWGDLVRRNSNLTASLDHSIQQADLGERGTYYRLQAGFFETAADAKSSCAAFVANRIDCIVVAR